MAHGLQGFPQASYYGKSRKTEPKTTPVNDKFENEYNNFIDKLKNKETQIIPETPVQEAPIIPETVVPADAPILNETTTTKKKKKKTETPVEE